MVHLSEELITQIKEANDILELAGEHFQLTQTGSIYQTTCTHEGEKHSKSLTFFPDTQSFYCFGCGAGSRKMTEGSDVISFTMWLENCTWQQAAMKLANRRAIRIPIKELSKEERLKQKLFEETNERNKIYWRSLKENNLMMEYLYNRGLDDDDIDKWRLGWVPLTDPTKAAGRLVFAIINDWGQTAGFSYRNMDEYFPRPEMPDTGPKYFNSPTSPIFNKGSILYGLHAIKKLIREKDYVIITEGFADTIIAQRYGLPAVSLMGTSLTEEHIKMVARYTKNVIVWLDGDPGGLGATLRHLDPLRAEGFIVKVITTPNQDPDDVIQMHREGIEEWVVNHAVMAGNFEVSVYMNKYKSNLTELKMKTIRELIPIFKRIGNAVEYELYVNEVANDLGIPPQTLLTEVNRDV
jgi:DNA primase